ncbi:MAG: DUF488 domain-containing protein [Ginsengibacter sp.]
MQREIYTIGHSTRTLAEFIELLQTSSIETLADVRSYPGSRRYPQFNKENLALELPAKNIGYIHIPLLGGRRKPSPGSKNTAWKNDAFRGYADYMETDEFKKGIAELEKVASIHRAAFMCSEAVWWRCHRSLISDYLKVNGWKVLHIINNRKIEEHPYTSVAVIAGEKLSYSASQQSIF